MALKIAMVDVWSGELADRPGGLAKVLEALAAGGASVDCVIARRDASARGKGIVFVTPLTGARQMAAAKKAGVGRSSVVTVRVEGPNKAGYGARLARAIAKAGVNLRGVSAATCGKNFVAYFGFDTAAAAKKAAMAMKSA